MRAKDVKILLRLSVSDHEERKLLASRSEQGNGMLPIRNSPSRAIAAKDIDSIEQHFQMFFIEFTN
jgi:hypothetical protein